MYFREVYIPKRCDGASISQLAQQSSDYPLTGRLYEEEERNASFSPSLKAAGLVLRKQTYVVMDAWGAIQKTIRCRSGELRGESTVKQGC